MFPLEKNGHFYSFVEGGLIYRDSFSRESLLSFDEGVKLKFSVWTKALSLKGSTKVPLDPLKPGEQRALLLEFFQRWKQRNPEAARKAAFDYCDGQKGFAPVAFIAATFFALPFAIGLLADSRNQFTCTQVLQHSSQMGEMDVVKFKRKRKGHYILDLAFTAPNGQVILGKDQLITKDETSIPKKVPVVFSPENPNCWSLTPNLSGTEINWAKRRYFGSFTLLFGLFFLTTSLWGISWSILKGLRKRPHKEDLLAFSK